MAIWRPTDDTPLTPLRTPFGLMADSVEADLDARGFTRYATKTLMDANTTAADGTHATVYADGTPGFNGDYAWRNGATNWRRLVPTRLGVQRNTAEVLAAGTPSWTDLCTVTAASTGGPCVADWVLRFRNGNSGAARTLGVRVLCDDAQVEDVLNYDAPLADSTGKPASYKVELSPAAGSHTWKLQCNASVASAIYVDHAVLTITEY